jgi:two-component system, chemotaxis family, sensor kinase CheA
VALDPALLRNLLKIFLTDLDQQGDFLTDALLVLERAESDDAGVEARREAYAAVMRSAHNLKGGARSLGLREVEAVFHTMESVFETLQTGKAPPSRGFVDRCRNALSEVRKDIEDQSKGIASAARLAAPLPSPKRIQRRRSRNFLHPLHLLYPCQV